MQRTYKRNILALSRNNCRNVKAISITYSEYSELSVTLVIQHAKRMIRISVVSVACLILPHF